MPFLATCPACGHARRQALCNYSRACPRCGTPWRHRIRTDPPIDPEAEPIRQTLYRLENFIGAACLFTPEEAFTAGVALRESIDAVPQGERRLRRCVINFLRARARLARGEPPG